MSPLARHFQMMAANNAWANDRLLAACEGLSEEEFAAPRTGFFPSIELTLNHILEVDRDYTDALEGRPRPYRDEPPLDAAGLRRGQAEQDARLIVLCETLDDEALGREVLTDRGERGMVAERTDAVLAHLFQHQIHHRGQAHAMLSGTSVPPPQLDEFFLRFDRHGRANRYGATP